MVVSVGDALAEEAARQAARDRFDASVAEAERQVGNPIPSFAVERKSHGLKEATMPRATPSKIDKIEHPQSHYATPDQLIDDRDLSVEEKINALKVWEQDARQMLTASGEGMPGSDEGIDPSNHHMLGQVKRAKDRLQRKLQYAVVHESDESSQ
jgi:hypothetical protein